MRRIPSAQTLAGLVGLGFIVIGVLGFVPGVVQDYGQLHWWKTGSGAELFGAFRTSILDNLVHIGIGVVGLAAGRAFSTARVYLTGGGTALFALGVYGLLIDELGGWNIFPFDRADDWLHLGIGVAMIYGGLAVVLPRLRPAAST